MSITTETGQVIPTGTWTLDAVHSTIGFEVDYMVGAFRGQFGDVEATLVGEEEGPGIAGSARVGSIEVKDENLEVHLQSPDFFDAERHPELSFESTKIDRIGDEVTIEGKITIKGITRPVTLTGSLTEPVTDPYGREKLGLQLETTLNRTDFDINWNVPLPDGKPALADDVKLAADLHFVREA